MMSGGRRYYNDETTKMRKGERTMMLQYSKGWMRDELMVETNMLSIWGGKEWALIEY